MSSKTELLCGTLSGAAAGEGLWRLWGKPGQRARYVGSFALLGAVVSYAFSLYSTNNQKPSHTNYFRLNGTCIHIAQTEQEIPSKIAALLADLSQQKHKVIGLDSEWKPTKASTPPPLALLQLSTEKECVLIRLCNVKTIPDCLKELLEDQTILKAGVAVAGDAKLIWNQYKILTRGLVDVQAIAHREDRVEKSGGLAGLALSCLRITLNKNHVIRCGDWEAPVLSEAQIQYGAIDAWVGQKLLLTFYEDSKSKQDLTSWCGSIIDTSSPHMFFPKKKGSDREGSSKRKTEEVAVHFPFRKTVLYENVQMQAPDGEILCSINYKKANWYIQRDLAGMRCFTATPNVIEWATENSEQPILRLKIQPGGRGHSGDEYYTSKKENKCVICGSAEKNCRYSIVPHSFRKHFPPELKSHSSHDIVLLCQRCLHRVGIFYEDFKRQLMKEYQCQPAQQWEVSTEILTLVKLASALLNQADKIPINRKEEMLNEIKKHLKKDAITDEDLQHVSKLIYKKKVDSTTPEYLIVKTLKTRQHFQDFIQRFRENFIKDAQPGHMPQGWRTDHPVWAQTNRYGKSTDDESITGEESENN